MIPFPFKHEVSALIADYTLISVTKGDPGYVEFDFFKMWEYWKKNKFNTLFMIHVHPDGCPTMSGVDKNMIQGWMKALPNVRIYFVVISKDVHGEIGGSCYLCHKNNITEIATVNKEQASFDNASWLTFSLVNWSCSDEKSWEEMLAYIIKNDTSNSWIVNYRTELKLL